MWTFGSRYIISELLVPNLPQEYVQSPLLQAKDSPHHYRKYKGIVRKCLAFQLSTESFGRFISSDHFSFCSIVRPSLSPSICISCGDVIARILLQRVGLCLRALRIELLAKLALGTTLRCLGSVLE